MAPAPASWPGAVDARVPVRTVQALDNHNRTERGDVSALPTEVPTIGCPHTPSCACACGSDCMTTADSYRAGYQAAKAEAAADGLRDRVTELAKKSQSTPEAIQSMSGVPSALPALSPGGAGAPKHTTATHHPGDPCGSDFRTSAAACDCTDGRRIMIKPGVDGKQLGVAVVCTVCLAGKNLDCRGLGREISSLHRRNEKLEAQVLDLTAEGE